MKFNLFKKKRTLFTPDQTATIKNMHALDVLEEKGLLTWNPSERRLFIHISLASLYIGMGVDAWRNFLGNVYNWQYFRESNAAWQSHTLKVEMHAVQEAKRTADHKLTEQELIRIKQKARDKMAATDVQPPKPDGFEFFVVDTATNTEESSPIVVVGNYDPENGFQMTDWNSVKDKLEVMQ